MKCLVLAFLFANGVISKESLYMKRAEIEDQQSSASGYAYQLHSGGPLSYATYGGGIGGGGIAGGIQSGGQLGYASIGGGAGLQSGEQLSYGGGELGGGGAAVGALGGGLVNQFSYPPLLGHYTQELPLQLPLTTEYKPQAGLGVVPYGIQAHPYALHYPLQAYRPVPVSIAESSNFAKGGGSSYNGANQNAHGEKGASGYKSTQGFDKGAQAKHANQDHKEYYNKQGANKAGHHDEAGHYGQKQEAAKGSQGSHFNEAKSHKKGSKTSGFHRIHHKDEYKKDHSFYDESDASGNFNKHGDFDSHHAAEKGGFEKGGHEDKAFQAGEHGAKGFVDKGNFNGQNSGFKGEEGKQSHYNNFQEFAKKGDEQQGKEFGYSKKDILHHGLA